MVATAKAASQVGPCSLVPGTFAGDAIAGLRASPKRIPPKYFYDSEGSALFEEITRLPEYYPTRAEMEILRDNAAAIAALIPEGAALVEFGSGSCTKVRILLDALRSPAAYVPVDICGEFVELHAANVAREYRNLAVIALTADFTKPFVLPRAAAAAPLRAGFFPGSTIGNFEPHQATAFLKNAGHLLGQDAVLVIGVDREKSPEILHAAYNDAAGVTARFNLNLLARMNRELGANFRLDQFEHHAFYNRERHRIEMHLASLKRQRVRVYGETIDFRAGETIHTENSYKYTVESFSALARGAGWTPLSVWTDRAENFTVHALTWRGAGAGT
jgi:dimethylhistidine N-methyltransferase